MGKILLLDEHIANKIAAGEVVERPASVVKELVENSIDAGATRIEIAVTDGGLSEILIADNGIGMDEKDAQMAFARHATSKISSADDLERIGTLGFRGEALPSIAAVSRLQLRTRTRDSVSGTEVVLEGGRIQKVSETGCHQGTLIIISDLFFNTPARKKHMKGPNTEAGHISEVINKFALGYPSISFRFKSNGRVVLNTSGQEDLLDCIANIYGADFARDMLPLEAESGGVSLTGYLGKPSLSRAARSHQTVYINGRYVQDRMVSEAVERAYHGLMMTGRYPVFVLKILLDAGEVDVNVHPAKTQVRLSQPRILGEFIRNTVSEVLSSGRLISSAVFEPAETKREQDKQAIQETWNIPMGESLLREKGLSSAMVDEPDTADISDAADGPGTADRPGPQAGRYPDKGTTKEEGFPALRPIGQIDCTYIVAQGEDGMYLVDQHAAHERILYEKYMERPEDFVMTEQLLFPVTLQLTHLEAQVLNDCIIQLADLGFVVEHFGGDSFLLRGIPAGLAKGSEKEIFLDLLDYFSRNRYTITNKMLMEKFLVTMACRNAIKANDRLGLPEMESLLGQMADLRQPYTCPHGRPTLLHFPAYELEKRFKRVL